MQKERTFILKGWGLIMSKKVMLLGGNYFQMTATKAAKRLGYHVISVDYLPDNPAHKYADEYHNVSTVDKEAVLQLAQKLKIDGIVSYASDVSAPTAAYVAEKMGLPTNPYKSVKILTNKELFRQFLKTKGFRSPAAKAFVNYSEAKGYYESLNCEVMLKPVDASGSKGVIKVCDTSDFEKAWSIALSNSRIKKVLVEEYINRKGYQIDGDIFLENGKIVFWGICNQHKDYESSAFTPIGLSYLQSILDSLNMKIGAYNVEYIVDSNNNVNVLEIGPRNGGNLIPDVIKSSTGIDMAELTIKQAVNDDIKWLDYSLKTKFASSYIIHSKKNGRYSSLEISDQIKDDILRLDVFVKKNDMVHKYENSSYGIGAMLIKHKSVEEMLYRMDNMEEFIKVIVS